MNFNDKPMTAFAAFNTHNYAVDDSVVSSESVWSSKNTVDKLCPAFKESGAVVTCEPVEGYPLSVTAQEGDTIHRCGKNLVNPAEYIKQSADTTLDGDVFTTVFNTGGQKVNRYEGAKTHPAGTYTVSVIPTDGDVYCAVVVYNAGDGATIASTNSVNQHNPKLTFTATAPFRVTICGPGDYTKYGTYSYKLQLEVGTTATDYEPYNGATFVQGEEIPALRGVNTLHANSGSITVAGRSDPNVVIEKLTNAIISLGGNV